ncbi:hypothetical protein IFM89_001344 [Coptis chinensis]|uniref:Uncharacterized protein n=1 Tax=Coptis chinensis TaxID=261450 RepID=A0A835H8F7_9MAGN|nr:hypothetical protein IFM89_001344 [Coptis chinensis]
MKPQVKRWTSRNKRLKRKKGVIGQEKKTPYGLGVSMESGKKSNSKRFESVRKSLPSNFSVSRSETPIVAPRYSLRSSCKENKKPPLAGNFEKSLIDDEHSSENRPAYVYPGDSAGDDKTSLTKHPVIHRRWTGGNLNEESEMDLAILSSNYLGVSYQSIVDVYFANVGDLEASLDMLKQLELCYLILNRGHQSSKAEEDSHSPLQTSVIKDTGNSIVHDLTPTPLYTIVMFLVGSSSTLGTPLKKTMFYTKKRL